MYTKKEEIESESESWNFAVQRELVDNIDKQCVVFHRHGYIKGILKRDGYATSCFFQVLCSPHCLYFNSYEVEEIEACTSEIQLKITLKK